MRERPSGSVLLALEDSKYCLRTVLLLHTHGAATLTWLTRRIPTSPNTVVRCVRTLKCSGIITDFLEQEGKVRRLYKLTSLGTQVATRPPAEWPASKDWLLRKP